MVTIHPVEPADEDTWLRMRCALWPVDSEAEHRDEIAQFFGGMSPRGSWSVLLAKDHNGNPLGFAELSVRTYAEGCVGFEIAYLEGWYVAPEARKLGVGRALIQAAEQWGRDRGLTEFASDADPNNAASLAAHRALGFEDAGLVQCFKKSL